MAFNRDKWEATIIEKYGSLELYRKFCSDNGKKTRSRGYPFRDTPGLAKRASQLAIKARQVKLGK